MNIAMVDQSNVDLYLERVQRFVNSVNTLKDRVSELLSARTPDDRFEDTVYENQTKPESFTAEPIQPTPVSQTVSEPVPSSPQVSSTPIEAADAGKQVEDINLDALISSLDLDDPLQI